MTARGGGLSNAIVSLIDANGLTRSVRTNSFGFYLFESVNSGEVYVVAVVSKKYQFVPQVVLVNESIIDLVFTAIE